MVLDNGYITRNGILAFQKGVLSQWFGAFKYQGGDVQFEDFHGVEFNCAEQYMMYRKAKLFGDQEAADRVLAASDPSIQKELGRGVKGYCDVIWTEHREAIVYTGNLLKFQQNEEFRKYLLSTNPNILVEAAPWDKVWGNGLAPTDARTYDESKWLGINLLGRSLMRVRKALEK